LALVVEGGLRFAQSALRVLEVVKVPQGCAIEAVKIPLLRSVEGFTGDIGAVLTRRDISTNLQ
jgi:hypothetical protein